MNPFFQLTVAVALSTLVIPLARHFAPRLGLVDMPDPRKVHTVPIPRVGGWGIALGSLLPIVLVYQPEPVVQAFLAGYLILFVFGIWDDARTLGHWTKFIGQLAAVGAVVFYGDVWVSRVPFLEVPLPPGIGKPFTMFAIIGVINAINHSDGLDGLAGGESLLSLIALAILGYMSGSALILSVSLATIGGIFGFLRYNSHPAYVFMGDCGSQVLGFTLGFLVVYLTQNANTAVSAALPLLILGVPLADILSVLYQRVRGHMNWFRATRNHIHHRLMALGFDHSETVVIIYSVQAVLAICAVLARYQADLTVTLIYVSVTATLLCALVVAEQRGWRVSRVPGMASGLSHTLASLRTSSAVTRGPVITIAIVTPALMLLSAVWVASIPQDLAVVAAALALVTGMQLAWPRTERPVLLRITVYAAAIFPGYLLISYPGIIPQGLQLLGAVALLVLAIAIVAYVRFGSAHGFGTTPTDYLIVCGVIALTVFGSIEVNSRTVVEAVLFATVLMYACEITVGSSVPGRLNRRVLQYATLGTLLIIVARGLL